MNSVSTVSGANSQPLEAVTVARNGTVVRDPRFDERVVTRWPAGPVTVDQVNLGDIGSKSGPSLRRGIVYLPNARGHLLIQEPWMATNGDVTQRWRVVKLGHNGRTAQLVQSGTGAVPTAVQVRGRFWLDKSV